MDKFKKGDIIDGKHVKEILFDFEILTSDCEIGNRAWIILCFSGSKEIVLTKNDIPYIAKWTEIDKIVEKYRKALLDIRAAISI